MKFHLTYFTLLNANCVFTPFVTQVYHFVSLNPRLITTLMIKKYSFIFMWISNMPLEILLPDVVIRLDGLTQQTVVGLH